MKPMINCIAPLALLTLALAGCGSTPGNTTESSRPVSIGTVTTQEPTGEKTPSNPGVGIIKSTAMTSCDTQEGDVNANGTVILPEGVHGTVQVTVSWTDPGTSVVLAQAVQKIDNAQTGKPTDWKVSAKLSKATGNVRCVLGAIVLPASE